MCGIAGGISKTGHPLSMKILARLQEALHHRGPDGRGSFSAGPVGLIHTRLAIIDPEHGQQPFIDEDGYVLVANGEVYNDIQVRAEVGEEVYKTGSDNESALHLYRKYGLGFSSYLRGMYALAIYDPVMGRLVLARDPFGIKPLYYLDTPETFWFASEPQAFMKAGVISPVENAIVCNQLLGLQYTTGRQTIYNEIQRLLPGEVAVVQAGGCLESVYTEKWNNQSDTGSSFDHYSALENFDYAWRKSIDLHRRSDVPYGIFLSSGTDSAAVMSAMAKLEDRPIIAFTAGFEGDTVHDEREQARNLAALVGAEHTCVEIRPNDFWNTLPSIISVLDDPVADYAIVPTYLLAKEASKSVKVVLTGEGADEIFAGYGRYRSGIRPWPFRKKPWSRHILARSGVLKKNPGSWRSEIDITERHLADKSLSPLQRLQSTDITHWLPNDLLTKVDRCLMAHGVEGRVPFLDRPLANFGFYLSDSNKVSGRRGKALLRSWLEIHCPQSKPFARKKGFSVPVGAWIASQATRLAPLIADQPGVRAFCDPSEVRALITGVMPDKALPAWLLLFYALWHQCHIRGVDSGGSVFDVLSERSSG